MAVSLKRPFEDGGKLCFAASNEEELLPLRGREPGSVARLQRNGKRRAKGTGRQKIIEEYTRDKFIEKNLILTEKSEIFYENYYKKK